ncbi:hypothetical protein EI555_000417, partial [Monodon monoceros]
VPAGDTLVSIVEHILGEFTLKTKRCRGDREGFLEALGMILQNLPPRPPRDRTQQDHRGLGFRKKTVPEELQLSLPQPNLGHRPEESRPLRGPLVPMRSERPLGTEFQSLPPTRAGEGAGGGNRARDAAERPRTRRINRDAQRLRPPARLAAPRCGPFSHPGARVADAIDNHRSFHDKHGFTGKRELEPEDEAGPGSVDRRLLENNVVRTIIEFLTFLQLKGDIDFHCPNRNYTFLESDRFKCMLSTRVKCDTCLILGLLP